MNQPRLQAYLKFLGNLPLTKVKFPIYRCPKVSADFIGKQDQSNIVSAGKSEDFL